MSVALVFIGGIGVFTCSAKAAAVIALKLDRDSEMSLARKHLLFAPGGIAVIDIRG